MLGFHQAATRINTCELFHFGVDGALQSKRRELLLQ
jgi:hypothetical protein